MAQLQQPGSAQEQPQPPSSALSSLQPIPRPSGCCVGKTASEALSGAATYRSESAGSSSSQQGVRWAVLSAVRSRRVVGRRRQRAPVKLSRSSDRRQQARRIWEPHAPVPAVANRAAQREPTSVPSCDASVSIPAGTQGHGASGLAGLLDTMPSGSPTMGSKEPGCRRERDLDM